MRRGFPAHGTCGRMESFDGIRGEVHPANKAAAEKKERKKNTRGVF